MEEGLLQPTEQADPLVGMVLQDRYRIVRKLGEGGMGAVYEGEHILIKRRVAIKCLHSQFAQNPEIVARFHREALAATSIGHQNIIEVTDMGRFDDGSVFMVLEFLNGRDWSHDIDNQGAQPVGKVIEIITQVCEALTAAHAKGIIHRDLKPENVFLINRHGTNNFVKVLDFGISKFKDASGGPGKAMTQTGATLGTPYYMAPEQAQGKKDIDHRADIYSLGVMLFQSLTGMYPFDDESYPMLVLKICTEPAPALRTYRPDLPEELEAIIAKLLNKDPAHRFQTCQELRDAVAPYREIDDTPEVSPDAPSTANMQSSVLTRQDKPAGAVGTPAPSEPPAAPPVNKTPLYVGAALVLLGGVGFGVAAATGAFSSDADLETAESTEIPTTEPPAEVPAAIPTPTPPSEPMAVAQGPIHVNVVVAEPNDPRVQLRIDGRRVPPQFINGTLPRKAEGEAYHIEASCPGYDPIDENWSLSEGQYLAIRLFETGSRRSRSSMRSSIRSEGGSGRRVEPTSGSMIPSGASTPEASAMVSAMVATMVARPAAMEPPPEPAAMRTIEAAGMMVEVTMSGTLDLSMAF